MLALNLLLVTVHTLSGWPVYAEWPFVKASQILDNPFGAAATSHPENKEKWTNKVPKGEEEGVCGQKASEVW